MTILGLHHIRFAVSDPSGFADFLVRRFDFQYHGFRSTKENSDIAVVLRHGSAVFVIDKRSGGTKRLMSNVNEHAKYSFCKDNVNYPVDTVCDACFQCNNIDEILARVKLSGQGSCLVTSKICDADGTIYYALLQSPFGNVQHTLIDLSQYHGSFLPSFQLQETPSGSSKNYFNIVDHLAYMVPFGQTDHAVNWYNSVFGFERLFINRDDLIEEGFRVESGVMGMKLKAIHGINLCAYNSSDHKQPQLVPVKFVFGEPLTSSKSDQISTFLEQHGGGGIQHVGLGTDNILEAVNHFKGLGACFVAPPLDYYNSINSSKHMDNFEVSLQQLMQAGILLESSNDVTSHEVSLPPQGEPWYIMQVFTRNLFKEQTFFLELIQRHRTEGGFGAGNIKALWDGVQAHLLKIKDSEQGTAT